MIGFHSVVARLVLSTCKSAMFSGSSSSTLWSSSAMLPSSVISESVSLLSGVKLSTSSWLARIAARRFHQSPQQHSEVAMATSTPGSPAQGRHNSFLHDLHLDKLSSGDWQRVSLAVGSRLHPVLNGSVLNISAQRVLRCANSASQSSSHYLNWQTRRTLSHLARLASQPLPRRWQVLQHSLRFISDQRLLALEARANQEADNAVVQAQYLEAVLEVDPEYLARRVESGRYAVDDDVRYLYRKALLAIERDGLRYRLQGKLNVSSKENEVVLNGRAVGDKEIKIPLEVNIKEKRGFFRELWYLARAIILAFFVAVLISSVFSAQVRGGTQNMTKDFQPDPGDKKCKFDDVQGIEEAKHEVRELVEFLKDPARFQRLGAKLPKGVLIVGPPGTGKTLLARAVAGEAEVPFFFASGSEFDEMFVGVGASRMRKLFDQARKHKPCVVFIDELDAVGGARVATAVHPYSRMTLNQLLVELDGYKELEGIVVIGATNFPESLDKALIRPGRFDRRVVITLPDVRARHDILKVHLAKVKLSPDVDLQILARGTSGFSGADLANMVNQAALKGSADGHEHVTMEDFEHAKDKIIMGPERRSAVIEQSNKEIVAYHEGGHALVALYTPGALPIHKATIVPRGSALGMVSQLPEKDELLWSKKQLLARLDVAMGGRVAEELVFGKDHITSGASSDVEVATKIARTMVTKYAMSEELGPLRIGDDDRLSPQTSLLVEEEIKKLLKESYNRAQSILQCRASEHKRLAEALLKYETLTAEEIKLVAAGKSLKRTL